MSGSLQSRVYGFQRHISSNTKKIGQYNSGASKRLGFYNMPNKLLGQYNGVNSGKNNLNHQAHPHY